ncbi:PhnD/SsuA/transferrin family substrate-binding protein [Variovorax sp.]|jgi:phosphonate transport system substrate-binding protein|uniref:PhnD/SsuA/transferrin family substrate-binding protein n=1 Tax=Variovorax sp. TaxID=1871043 RepID=UPI000A7D007B|nr:PhnD/SsuA/transferrin family substrate-binding protein [Variovorax sp.]MBS77557.1 phosphonate ABC transporter substrate-binding protein [Variovorax sp.]
MRRRTLLQALPALAGWTSLDASRAAERPRIRIGLTAVILADQVAFLSRWGDYLSSRTGASVTFSARESYQEILDLLFSGQLEAAWICGYPYVLQQTRLELLAVPIYEDKPLYRSYLIRPASKSNGIEGWTDLKGRVLAYSDPLSNSGWLVPQAQLRAAGLLPRDLRRGFFAHGHRNVAEAVAARLADAGCIDGYVWETMRRQKMTAAERTEVVWRSEPYGFPPLVVRKGALGELTQQLRLSLLAMSQDVEGQGLLQALNLDGFAQEPGGIFASIEKLAAEQARVS